MEEAAPSSVKMDSEVESLVAESSDFSSDQQQYLHVKISFILAHEICSDHRIAFYA